MRASHPCVLSDSYCWHPEGVLRKGCLATDVGRLEQQTLLVKFHRFGVDFFRTKTVPACSSPAGAERWFFFLGGGGGKLAIFCRQTYIKQHTDYVSQSINLSCSPFHQFFSILLIKRSQVSPISEPLLWGVVKSQIKLSPVLPFAYSSTKWQ